MLSGQTVLIVEAQYLIALDLQNSLDDLAPGKVIIAQDAVHAEGLAADWNDCALAIIEVERELQSHIALAGALADSGIPVVGLTADSDVRRHIEWPAGAPILIKPAPAEMVTAAVAAALSAQKE